MPRGPDWAGVADSLGRERERLAERLPEGLSLWLEVHCMGFSVPTFHVTIHHRARNLFGNGEARNPERAAELALKDLAAKTGETPTRAVRRAKAERPPPAGPGPTLFG